MLRVGSGRGSVWKLTELMGSISGIVGGKKPV